jgi:PAS domain S-box-containing protein
VARSSMRLNLPARGILLVGFPLLFQIVFAVWLCLLLQQVQAETQEQVQSRELMSVGNKVLTEIAAFYFLFTGESESETQIAQKTEEMVGISADLNRLVTLASSNPVSQADAAGLRQDTAKLEKLFKVWTEQQKLGDLHAARMRPYFNLASMTLTKAFAQDLWQLITAEEAHYINNYAEQQLSKSRIHNLFLIGALGSAMSAILLSYIYALLINAPIKRLKENSHLLSLRKPLLPALQSTDEFAELDRTFRNVSSAIRQASANERAMIDNAEDMICSLDHAGVFSSINNYVETMLGYKAASLLGLSLLDLILPEDIELARSELRAARQSNQNHSFELRMQHKDCTPVDTRWACFWSGSEDSLFCVVNDNTEQKRIERLKYDFIEVITEDLRAPLTSMKGSMQNIIAGATGQINDPVKMRLESMVGSMDRLILLADNLLDSQKLSGTEIKLDRKQIDLADVIKQAIEMMRGAADAKQVTLKMTPGP